MVRKLVSSEGERKVDQLIAIEKVKKLKEHGIPIDNDTPYIHSSTRGGKYAAFFPQKIKSHSSFVGFVIFIVAIVLIEVLSRLF